ncbi:MAG: GNAT family N-acetyltransferase [Actinomycetota bacterium]
MSAEYRFITDSEYDHDAIVRIGRAIRPDDFISVASMRDWEENQRRGNRFEGRWLATVSGSVVGSAEFGQVPWIGLENLYAHVMVHPDHQQCGIGRALLERTETTAREHGAVRILSHADEREGRTIRFLERAGFDEIDRNWRSTLDLTEFDPSRWRADVDRVASSGVRIVSVASLAKTRPGWKRDLHRLYVQIGRDIPSVVAMTDISFDDFDATSLDRRSLEEGFLVAMDGADIVGLSEPRSVDDDPSSVAQALTGVRADYRSRGIATALKAAAAIWAKEQGYSSMRTFNAQSNTAMLAVNERLGYEREHAQIEYAKSL